MDHAPARRGGPDDPCHAVAQHACGPPSCGQMTSDDPAGAPSDQSGRPMSVSEREYSERPWGNYTVLDDDAPDHKVKRIVVHPGKRLSYQRHAKRAEHWFIVSGTAHGDPRRRRSSSCGRAKPSTSRSEGAHRIANEGTSTSSSSRCSTAPTSARTTSSAWRTTTAAVPRRAPDDRHRRLLAAGPTYSFEFFPPKNDKELATLARTIGELQPLEPSFVSVTYRGGAESRQRTFDLVSGMLHTTTLNPMAHLICVAHTRLELADILVSLRKAGVENLMALGGDPPEDPTPGPGELAYATELVELAHAIGGFSVGVAAHPAGHPRSPDLRATGTSWPPSSSWPTSA